MFAELLGQPGVVEVLELRSRFGFLAVHGGELERMTDVVASEAARRSGGSLYAVLHPADLGWHVPSRLIDPAHSPALTRFLDHVETVVSLHGYGRRGRWTDVLVGGGNRVLAAEVAGRLEAGLPDYAAVVDLAAIPPALRGLHPENPVNRPRRGGVQLELPPRIRGLSPVWADWAGPGFAPPTEALITALAETARAHAGCGHSTSTVPPALQ